MEGPAGAFPGAIDLSVQTRSGKELLDRPVSASAVLRSTEDKPQPKSTETSTSPTSPRETPANRSDKVTLPNLEVNDSPCDGGDQSLDESDVVHLAPYDLRLRADRHGRKRNRPNWGDLVKRYNHGIFIPLSVHPVDQLSTVVHRQSRTFYRTSQKAFDAAIQCG
ncbi:uncharacterized protein LOC119765539 isoform X1 [Culex quinquefasciatus]|uniref:uncharacterized protein LOC119765539 isoform X1 n=1 Tax=Culex quinquefasciatus TaxID=7176 RepID=UPI0018E2B817|nr:uncharacterized protein LOC119765539 isoform X1 [Culex quinquefasciatus]